MSAQEASFVDAIVSTAMASARYRIALTVEERAEALNRELTEFCRGRPYQVYAFVSDGRVVLDVMGAEH